MSKNESISNGPIASNDTSATKDAGLVEYSESLDRLGGDVELFKEFVQIFQEDSPQLLENVFTAADSSDHDALARSAHALKGLISNFGAKRCCELALEYELAGKNNVSETMVDQKKKMQSLYNQLCEELKQYV